MPVSQRTSSDLDLRPQPAQWNYGPGVAIGAGMPLDTFCSGLAQPALIAMGKQKQALAVRGPAGRILVLTIAAACFISPERTRPDQISACSTIPLPFSYSAQ